MSKNVLIVSDTPTHPTIAGNRQGILACSKLLEDDGWNVILLYIITPLVDKNTIAEMKIHWKDRLYIYRVSIIQFIIQRLIIIISRVVTKNYLSIDIFCPWLIRRKIRKLLKQYEIDSVIVNYIWMTHLFEKVNIKNKIVFTHDVFTHKYLKGNSKWFSFSPNMESKALQRCNKILAVQEMESNYFQFLSPTSKVYTVYCPLCFHRQKIVENCCDILFFSGENKHNLKGIRSFIKDVLPIIRNKYPKVILRIGGSICSCITDLSDNDSICLVGKVNNPSDFYAQGNVVINPVFEGTGLKIKTIEALSYGKVVLAHPHSFEGVYDSQNIPMYKCTTAEDYVNCLREIYSGHFMYEKNQKRCSDYIERMRSSILAQYRLVLS